MDFISPCLSCSCNPAKEVCFEALAQLSAAGSQPQLLPLRAHTKKAEREAKERVVILERRQVNQRQPALISPYASPCHSCPITQGQEVSPWVSQGQPGAAGEPRRQRRIWGVWGLRVHPQIATYRASIPPPHSLPLSSPVPSFPSSASVVRATMKAKGKEEATPPQSYFHFSCFS